MQDAIAGERKRVAKALTKYFEDGPGTFRMLLDYLNLDYRDGMDEGWLALNNAIVAHENRISAKATDS